jgi:hypothetical protein
MGPLHLGLAAKNFWPAARPGGITNLDERPGGATWSTFVLSLAVRR